MRNYIFSMFVIGYLSLATPVQADKIIRWVDQNGVTNFANTPPKGQTSVEEVHVRPTNKADVPTTELSASLHAGLSAIQYNQSSATRSAFVIKGPPKKVLTPMARPSSKRVDQRYRGRVR